MLDNNDQENSLRNTHKCRLWLGLERRPFWFWWVLGNGLKCFRSDTVEKGCQKYFKSFRTTYTLTLPQRLCMRLSQPKIWFFSTSGTNSFRTCLLKGTYQVDLLQLPRTYIYWTGQPRLTTEMSVQHKNMIWACKFLSQQQLLNRLLSRYKFCSSGTFGIGERCQNKTVVPQIRQRWNVEKLMWVFMIKNYV